MRQHNKHMRDAIRLALSLHSVGLFDGVDFSGVDEAYSLKGYVTNHMPCYIKVRQVEVSDSSERCLKSSRSGKPWDLLTADEAVCRIQVTQFEHSGSLESQRIELVVATRAAFECFDEFDYASPVACDEAKQEKCLFVMTFRVLSLGDGGRQLEIAHRAVHPALHRRGVMKTASVRALVEIYMRMGDMPVSSYALHPATALFMATSEREREAALAQLAVLNAPSCSSGAAEVTDEVRGVCLDEAISLASDTDSVVGSDAATVSSIGSICEWVSDDEEKSSGFVAERGLGMQKNLKQLLLYHCAQLHIPFVLPDAAPCPAVGGLFDRSGVHDKLKRYMLETNAVAAYIESLKIAPAA